MFGRVAWTLLLAVAVITNTENKIIRNPASTLAALLELSRYICYHIHCVSDGSHCIISKENYLEFFPA